MSLTGCKLGTIATMMVLPLSLLPALAQGNPAQDAMMELPAKNGAHMTVGTLSWPDGGDIPLENTQFGNNAFPGLIWSSGPKGTQSYAIVVQDTDALQNGEPVLHLTLYDIPGDATRLNVGMVPEGNPRGSNYGPNYMGNAQPYLGPYPPPGPKHHYHFQIFALDTAIPADPKISYDRLVSAMRGHVLASGEVVGVSAASSALPTPAGVTNAAPQAGPVHRHEL